MRNPFDGSLPDLSTPSAIKANTAQVRERSLADLSPLAQICAVLGMILGRLEVIALLPALNPTFWQR